MRQIYLCKLYGNIFIIILSLFAGIANVSAELIDSGLSENKVCSKIFCVKYVKPEVFKKAFENIPGLTVSVCTYPPSIIVSGKTEQMQEIEKIIKVIDCEVPRVKIACEIIEVNHEHSEKIGIEWNEISSTATIVKNIVKNPENFCEDVISSSKLTTDTQTGFVIHHNNLENNGKILARPYIVTLNGEEAYLSTGDEVPIFSRDSYGNPYVDFKRVGIELYVTPVIMDDKSKVLNLQARAIVNVISKESSQNGLTAPQISAREAKTNINIKSGQTLVIGGLYKEENVWSESKIPLLSQVPFIGYLFKNSSSKYTTTDVLILITPAIIPAVENELF